MRVTRNVFSMVANMEPAMALAIMCAIATKSETDALHAMVKLARVLAELDGQIEMEDWETISEAGAVLWNIAMGDYAAEQLTIDVLARMRRG